MVAGTDLGLSFHSPLSPRRLSVPQTKWNMAVPASSDIAGSVRARHPALGSSRLVAVPMICMTWMLLTWGRCVLTGLGGSPNITLGCGPALVERAGFQAREG